MSKKSIVKRALSWPFRTMVGRTIFFGIPISLAVSFGLYLGTFPTAYMKWQGNKLGAIEEFFNILGQRSPLTGYEQMVKEKGLYKNIHGIDAHYTVPKHLGYLEQGIDFLTKIGYVDKSSGLEKIILIDNIPPKAADKMSESGLYKNGVIRIMIKENGFHIADDELHGESILNTLFHEATHNKLDNIKANSPEKYASLQLISDKYLHDVGKLVEYSSIDRFTWKADVTPNKTIYPNEYAAVDKEECHCEIVALLMCAEMKGQNLYQSDFWNGSEPKFMFYDKRFKLYVKGLRDSGVIEDSTYVYFNDLIKQYGEHKTKINQKERNKNISYR